MNTLAIETKDLKKTYDGKIYAVDGIDLQVEKNTVLALLGPNGAGKTTTISMLVTLITPSSGQAKILGYDLTKDSKNIRKKIGVTFQEMAIDDQLTGQQVLEIHGKLYGMKGSELKSAVDEIFDLIELQEVRNKKVKSYSGGMKRRLELGRALLTKPEILFLDEPTLGVDVQTRAKIWDYIIKLKKEYGMTIILTTHYMDEAQSLADKVEIIDHGKIITQGTVEELIESLGSDIIKLEISGDSASLVKKLKALDFVDQVTSHDGWIQVGVDNSDTRVVPLIQSVIQQGYSISNLNIKKPSLGEVFFKYTGRELRE